MIFRNFRAFVALVAPDFVSAIAFGQEQMTQPSRTTCDVTWRKVDNPHVISGTVTIPANQTVCLEPGVVVQWADNSRIDLLGQMIGMQFADIAIGNEVSPGRHSSCPQQPFSRSRFDSHPPILTAGFASKL